MDADIEKVRGTNANSTADLLGTSGTAIMDGYALCPATSKSMLPRFVNRVQQTRILMLLFRDPSSIDPNGFSDAITCTVTLICHAHTAVFQSQSEEMPAIPFVHQNFVVAGNNYVSFLRKT